MLSIRGLASNLPHLEGLAFLVAIFLWVYVSWRRKWETAEREARARQQAEKLLRDSENRLQLALAASRMGVWQWDLLTNRVYWSPECYELVGVKTFDGTFEGFTRLVHPDDLSRLTVTIYQAIAEHKDYAIEFRIIRTDNTVFWLANLGRADYDETGVPLRMVGTVTDIDGRKQSEQALEQQRLRLEGIVNAALDGIITITEEQQIVVFNTAAEHMFGYRAAEVLGQTIDPLLPPHLVDRHRKHIRDFGQTGEPPRAMGQFGSIHGRRKNGEVFPIEASISKIQLDGRKLFTVICRDVTERVKAEFIIRDSQERFRQLAENIREVFWMTDSVKNQILYVSPAYAEIWGRPVAELHQSPHTWADSIHPEDRAGVLAAVADKQPRGEYDEVYRILRPDGSLRWIHDRAFPIRDASGTIYRMAGIAEDITSRRLLEHQLLQSQKMEAIGQLAGGVAHDFNNLLTVVAGNASLLLLPDALPEQITSCAQEIANAAERAAGLTRQLLLFSRKQVLQLTRLDLNETVSNMTKMLQRILGEDIVLQTEYAATLPIISADAGMIEQVLLNLVVNSRDAMPKGGRLRIATDIETLEAQQATPDAAPGTYVCLTVTDTGCGIDPEHVPHIFEPFFTTKEVGKGTGLGLATIYGIVKQHRGRIALSSEVNRGTTFRICFPALAASRPETKVAQAPLPLPRGSETILLVEDEKAVRNLVANLLTRSGYTVLQACSGVEALSLWQQHHSSIDLLLTDVIMPDGLTGLELAAQLKAQQPQLAVIYTSGYSPDLTGTGAAITEGVNFLQKPYPGKKLVEMVRAYLDQR